MNLRMSFQNKPIEERIKTHHKAQPNQNMDFYRLISFRPSSNVPFMPIRWNEIENISRELVGVRLSEGQLQARMEACWYRVV